MGSLADLRNQADSGDDQPKTGTTRKSQVPNLYCLDPAHSPRLVTEDRFFYADPNDPTCPVCPVCNKQVSAQGVACNAKGQPQIPDGVAALAGRIGEPI